MASHRGRVLWRRNVPAGRRRVPTGAVDGEKIVHCSWFPVGFPFVRWIDPPPRANLCGLDGDDEVVSLLRMFPVSPRFVLEETSGVILLRLRSEDGANRLTRACVLALTDAVHHLTASQRPLVITGGHRFFSAGADLAEIAALTGPDAYRFSQMGQALMNAIEQFPAPVYAAIEGYCMGGGLDLALACHGRVACRRFRASGSRLGADHGLGRDTAPAASGWKRSGFRRSGDRREDSDRD